MIRVRRARTEPTMFVPNVSSGVLMGITDQQVPIDEAPKAIRGEMNGEISLHGNSTPILPEEGREDPPNRSPPRTPSMVATEDFPR